MNKYKVKCTKAPDFDTESPSYTLSYGRGKAKLTATLYRLDNEWRVKGLKISTRLKKEAVVEWGVWAEENYAGLAHEEAKPTPSAVKAVTPKVIAPPSLKARKKRSGPPAFKRSAAPAKGVNRPSHPEFVDTYNDVTDGPDNPYLANMLSDKGLFTRDNPGRCWTLTPLGALDEVFNWMQQNLPFTATLEYPWVRVTKVLQRAFPKDEKYQQTGIE